MATNFSSLQWHPVLTPSLAKLSLSATNCMLPFTEFTSLKNLCLDNLHWHDNGEWSDAVWKSSYLHGLTKLDFLTPSEAVPDDVFHDLLACLPRIRNLQEVNISPFYIDVSTGSGLSIFEPFRMLTRFALQNT